MIINLFVYLSIPLSLHCNCYHHFSMLSFKKYFAFLPWLLPLEFMARDNLLQTPQKLRCLKQILTFATVHTLKSVKNIIKMQHVLWFIGYNQPVDNITDHAPKQNDLYQYSILYYKIAYNRCNNIYICSCTTSAQTDCAKAVKS